MKKLFALIFLLLIFSCSTDSEIEKIEYEFHPAFLSPLTYSIDLNKNTLRQKSRLIKYRQNFYGSNNLIDKTYKISNQNLLTFLDEINSVELDSSITHKRNVLDGIGFKFSKIDQKNDSISLTSVSPIRMIDYEIDYKVLDAFFRLANSTIKDHAGLSITEKIQDYFSYPDLPIKYISSNPLEYRVSSNIYGCDTENLELIEFLDSLPNNEPVIFDLRNGSFAPCLSDIIDKYNNEKHLFYFGNHHITSTDFHLIELNDQLVAAKKENLNNQIESLEYMIKESHKFKEEIERKVIYNENTFRTKDEILKTIANNVYN